MHNSFLGRIFNSRNQDPPPAPFFIIYFPLSLCTWYIQEPTGWLSERFVSIPPVRLCGMFRQNVSTVEPQIIIIFFEWFSAPREARAVHLLLSFERGHLKRID